jgi:hypothetical protein
MKFVPLTVNVNFGAGIGARCPPCGVDRALEPLNTDVDGGAALAVAVQMERISPSNVMRFMEFCLGSAALEFGLRR